MLKRKKKEQSDKEQETDKKIETGKISYCNKDDETKALGLTGVSMSCLGSRSQRDCF
jgi:hypothetical protein